MILQAIALAFHNNPVVTFQTCEANHMTGLLFQTWLEFMPKFSKEFELRRVIFGLVGVLRCPPDQFPALIGAKIATIFQTCADLVCKQYKVRLESVIENENSIKEEQELLLQKGADDDGFVSDNSMDDSEGGDNIDSDDDAEFIKTKKALAKYNNGVDINSNESDDDDFDDEYEFQGGDMGLYDSNLDEIDEIRWMRDTVQGIMQNQMLA